MSEPEMPERAMLAEARAEVAIADHKASMVLASLGIGFAAVLGGLLAGDWAPMDLTGPSVVLWWVGAVCALGSVGSAAFAVWPRFKTSTVRSGIYYWGHIATFSSFEECTMALDRREAREVDRTRRQLWELSRIVRTKYRLVRASFILSAVAVAVFLLSAALA